MLVYMDSFSYMSYAVLCGEFLLQAPYCFMWGVSLTYLVLFPVGSFSYTLVAVVCGVSLTRLMMFYVESFSYMPLAVVCGEFLLHASGVFCGEFLLHTAAVLCGEFLLHALAV